MPDRLKFFLIIAIIGLNCVAQDEENTPVTNTFHSSLVINTQSVEMVNPGTWEFVMQHRFGKIDWEQEPWKDLFGLDLSSNIRLGFIVPLGEKINLGFGRSNFKKIFDFEAKYSPLKQTKSNSVPLSISIYGNLNLRSDDFPETGPQYFYSDSVTPFTYKFAHRLSYLGEITVGRKWNRTFSTQLSTVLVHKNLVDPDKENTVWSVPVSVRVRTGLSSNLLFEYIWMSRQPSNNLYPLSLAWEINSATHNFQIVLSSSNLISEQELYYGMPAEYSKGQFYLGFNIKKVFYNKRRFR